MLPFLLIGIRLKAVTLSLLLISPQGMLQQKHSQATLQPKLIQLDLKSESYIQILGGPPESATMESGIVTLTSKSSVGIHSTKNYEELLVILEGEGVMSIKDQRDLQLRKDCAVYCPPKTEHDIQNTGSGVLRYIYIAAKATER